MNQHIVIFKDNLTVQKIDKIKETLLKTLELYDTILIQFDTIDKVDLTFFQLICALHKSVTKQKKSLTITGTVPDLIKIACINLGFKKHDDCVSGNVSCIWQENNLQY